MFYSFLFSMKNEYKERGTRYGDAMDTMAIMATKDLLLPLL
jgi:hypothetical protein